MMKKSRSFILFLFFILSFATTHAFCQVNTSLQNQRIDVIKQYVTLLGEGNYQSIPHLFTENAIAVSSSGITDNPPHFYKTLFTQTIKNPQSSLINIFEGQLDQNMMAVYFNYSWNNSKGEKVSAKFLDLFIFQNNTTKIKNIFVFSNTFKQDIMKQLG